MRARCLIVVISLAVALAACGNKGQLVLPAKPPAPAKKTDKTDPEPAKPQPADPSALQHPTSILNAQ